MQSAIHQSGAHGGHGAGEHHGHSPHAAVGRGKPVGGAKSGTTKPFPTNPAASGLHSPSIGGGSTANIPAAVSKRGLPKNTGMLTGDAK